MTDDRLSPLFTWRSAIARSDLPPTARHVALTVSLHMSEMGDSCFPSLVRIAAETGLHKETVHIALDRLEADGYLTVHRPKTTGRGRVNHYEASLPAKRSDHPTVSPPAESVSRDDVAKRVSHPTVSAEGSDHPTDSAKEGSDHPTDSAKEGSDHPTVGRKTKSKSFSTTFSKENSVEPIPRKRDVLFEAVCKTFGYDWHAWTQTTPQRGVVNRACAELRAAGIDDQSFPSYVEWLVHDPHTPLVEGKRLTVGSVAKWVPDYVANSPQVVRPGSSTAAAAADLDALKKELGIGT